MGTAIGFLDSIRADRYAQAIMRFARAKTAVTGRFRKVR